MPKIPRKKEADGTIKDVIYGGGEVGKALYDLLSKKFKVEVKDRIESKCIYCPGDEVRFVHICIPYDETFVQSVTHYAKVHAGKVVIIHSTIPPGTTEAIHTRTGKPIIYSPIRGVHSRFVDDLKRYTKWYAVIGDIDQDKCDAYAAMFEKSQKVDNPTSLELAKVNETTLYGVLIAYWKSMDEVSREIGANPDILRGFCHEVNEHLHNRPVMYNDGKPIGGHCVIPNLELLPDSAKAIKRFVEKWG